MKKKVLVIVLSLVILAIPAFFISKHLVQKDDIFGVIYPFRNALFPPEFPAPTFKWYDLDENVKSWKVSVITMNGEFKIDTVVDTKEWQPGSEDWYNLKTYSNYENIDAEVSRHIEPGQKLRKAGAKLSFRISKDEVGAPILYREIPLPFAFAEVHLDSMSYRLVNVGSEDPPYYVMRKFMVCGNCHSFSDDGKVVGLDFDAAHRDKGGYFIDDIKDSLVFDTSNYLSWNKLQDRRTFGMFSKVSPNGRYIATTIKDRVLIHNFGFNPEVIPFSQLFFPVNGVLAIFDRETGRLYELPGANSPDYVQSNAFWTPDGKNIVFSRAKALPYDGDTTETFISDEALKEEFIKREWDFKFDVCIVPFNDGDGGEARPIKGASDNGMSNYFPAVSPDGKWLVFCKAENYMLLMPDSRLYIVPLKGGRARKLKSNFWRMNSWHAWSPNSKWMVFSSKGMSAYTDMFLTHIDEKGNSSIPVLIEKARVEGRAANYPEFLNVDPDYTFSMIYNYVNMDHIHRAVLAKDTLLAKSLYQQFIDQGQYSLADEYIFLGNFNFEMGDYKEAERFYLMAREKEPQSSQIGYLLSRVRRQLN